MGRVLAIMMILAGTSPQYPILNDSFSVSAGTDNVVVYKKFSDTSCLTANIAVPSDWTPQDKRACLIMWHGGGWQGGDISQYSTAASFFSSKGAVVIRPTYRMSSTFPGATPVDSTKDALSMAAWVLKYADRLGVDTNKIVCCGSSAGGQLAAATTMSSGLGAEAPGVENFHPAAYLLNFPALNLFQGSYVVNVVHNDQLVREASPIDNVRAGLSPMVIYNGTADTAVPIEQAYAFQSVYQSYSNSCTVVPFEGQPHSFYNSEPYTSQINSRMYEFLQGLGVMNAPTQQIARFTDDFNRVNTAYNTDPSVSIGSSYTNKIRTTTGGAPEFAITNGTVKMGNDAVARDICLYTTAIQTLNATGGSFKISADITTLSTVNSTVLYGLCFNMQSNGNFYTLRINTRTDNGNVIQFLGLTATGSVIGSAINITNSQPLALSSVYHMEVSSDTAGVFNYTITGANLDHGGTLSGTISALPGTVGILSNGYGGLYTSAVKSDLALDNLLVETLP